MPPQPLSRSRTKKLTEKAKKNGSGAESREVARGSAEEAATSGGARGAIGEPAGWIERDRQAIERDGRAIERDRQAIERDRRAIEHDRRAIERDRRASGHVRGAIADDRRAIGDDREPIASDRRAIGDDPGPIVRDPGGRVDDRRRRVSDPVPQGGAAGVWWGAACSDEHRAGGARPACAGGRVNPHPGPLPEGSRRHPAAPTPAQRESRGAEGGSRAAQPASVAGAPLTRSSTPRPSGRDGPASCPVWTHPKARRAGPCPARSAAAPPRSTCKNARPLESAPGLQVRLTQ